MLRQPIPGTIGAQLPAARPRWADLQKETTDDGEGAGSGCEDEAAEEVHERDEPPGGMVIQTGCDAMLASRCCGISSDSSHSDLSGSRRRMRNRQGASSARDPNEAAGLVPRSGAEPRSPKWPKGFAMHAAGCDALPSQSSGDNSRGSSEGGLSGGFSVVDAAASLAPTGAASARSPQWSLGSTLHGSGECKPCGFYWRTMGCKDGAACNHCHLCTVEATREKRKSRKQELKREKKTCRSRRRWRH